MWREDDFEDKGKQIKSVFKDRAGELVNDPNLGAEGEAERFDGRAQELSH